MRINIQAKLFMALAGLTTIALLGMLFSVTDTLTQEIDEKIIKDFNNTQRIFSQQQQLIYDRLVETSLLIGENSTFKANVELNDPASVYFSVEEFSAFAEIDLFIVTNASGNVLARLGEPDLFGDNISDKGTVFEAMNGNEPDPNNALPELWSIDSSLYQIVTVPIYAADDIIGTITLGILYGKDKAVELKGTSDIDIHFFNDAQLIGSSFIERDQNFLQKLIKENRDKIDQVIEFSIASEAFIAQIEKAPHFTFISPLGHGEKAYYLATIPTAIERAILSSIQQNMFYILLVFLLLTIIFAFILGRNFSRPILKLSDGMNKVKEGDLDITVKATTKDEIGQLTRTFNEMIVGLRERLHLSKYVGAHTMDMVRKSSSDEVALGGTREELTVLFSDIRGFTAYSEKREPEEVIAMLNRYLGFQAEIVARYEGSVDKYVGDEMFALFTGENATERALKCAIDIQKRVEQEHADDPVPIFIGIGINHGPVILGNMGAQDRMDYTALGATVNLGARLCGSAGPGKILIPKTILDKETFQPTQGELFLMAFKGISEKLKIVEVLSA